MLPPDYPAGYIPKYKPEIISYVYDKLYKQGKKSVEVDATTFKETCVYRRRNGDRCGIGWMIPDHVYTNNIENHTVDDIGSFIDAKQLPWYTPENMEFLEDIQKNHDEITLHFHNELRERFYKLAIKWGLDVKFLDH